MTTDDTLFGCEVNLPARYSVTTNMTHTPPAAMRSVSSAKPIGETPSAPYKPHTLAKRLSNLATVVGNNPGSRGTGATALFAEAPTIVYS